MAEEKQLAEIRQQITRFCVTLGIPDDDQVINAYARAYERGLKQVFVLRTPTSYYDVDLEARRAMLGSPCKSVAQLTKCLFYENKVAPADARDAAYSRYYLIIYQYIRKFSEPKFHVLVKALKKDRPELAHLTKQSYSYQFVDEADAQKLCNAPHNGMSPIGLADMKIPVFIDAAVDKMDYIFVGGLDPFVKAKISVKQLIAHYNTVVGLITDPLEQKE